MSQFRKGVLDRATRGGGTLEAVSGTSGSNHSHESDCSLLNGCVVAYSSAEEGEGERIAMLEEADECNFNV